MMKRLKCDSVVKALDLPDVFTSLRVDTPILAMEFCSGGDLRKVLNKPVSFGDNFSVIFTYFTINSFVYFFIHKNSTTAAALRKRKFDRSSNKLAEPWSTFTVSKSFTET